MVILFSLFLEVIKIRASGYRKGEVIGHYLTPTIIIAVAGSAIGNLIGYFVLVKPFLNIYYTTYSVGPIAIEFDFRNFVFTTIMPVAIMLIINFIMLWRKLSLLLFLILCNFYYVLCHKIIIINKCKQRI